MLAASHRLRAAGAAALLGLVGAASACKDTKAPTLPKTAATAGIPDSADQVMYGLRTNLTTDGIRRGTLFADTAFFFDNGNRIEMKRVRTVFYAAAGDSNAVMTSQTGTYDVRRQKLDGRGDVKLASVDGRRLSSPHLVYDRFANQVTSDTSFVFTQPGRTIEGIGLRTDPQLRNFEIARNARGRTRLAPGGGRR